MADLSGVFMVFDNKLDLVGHSFGINQCLRTSYVGMEIIGRSHAR